MNRKSMWLDYSKKVVWMEWFHRLPKNKQDIYFHPELMKLYEAENKKANCFIFSKNGSFLMYPFLKQEISQAEGYFDITTPYGYGGPIANTDSFDFLQEAYDCFYDEAKNKNIIAEVIKFHPLINNHLSIEGIFRGDILEICPTVYVDLDIDDDLRWKSIYTHANRKNINKAKRNKMGVRFEQGEVAWMEFQKLYEANLDHNKVDPFYYFSSQYYQMIRENLETNYVLVSCEMENKIVTSMLVFLGGAFAHCHLIGTDQTSKSLGGNNLLHHELILWCKEKKCKFLHIGGGRSSSETDNLYRFKANFSDKSAKFMIGENVLNVEKYEELSTLWLRNNQDHPSSHQLLKYRI
jgi:hypothetical protein